MCPLLRDSTVFTYSIILVSRSQKSLATTVDLIDQGTENIVAKFVCQATNHKDVICDYATIIIYTSISISLMQYKCIYCLFYVHVSQLVKKKPTCFYQAPQGGPTGKPDNTQRTVYNKYKNKHDNNHRTWTSTSHKDYSTYIHTYIHTYILHVHIIYHSY